MTGNQQWKAARVLTVVGIVLLLPFVPFVVIGALQLLFGIQILDHVGDIFPSAIWWVGVLGVLALFAAHVIISQEPDWEATLEESHRIRIGTLALALQGELTQLTNEELGARARLVEQEMTGDLHHRKWAASVNPEIQFEGIERGSVIFHFTVYLLVAGKIVTSIRDLEETIDALNKFFANVKSIAKWLAKVFSDCGQPNLIHRSLRLMTDEEVREQIQEIVRRQNEARRNKKRTKVKVPQREYQHERHKGRD